MRHLTGMLLMLIVIATLLAPATRQSSAQSTTDSKFETTFVIDGSADNKIPDITSSGSTVYYGMAPGQNGSSRTAQVYTKQDTADSFGSPFILGPATGSSDPKFTTVALGSTADGSRTGAVWLKQDGASTISFRLKIGSGEWGPTRVVVSGAADVARPFRVYPDVTLGANGRVFVTWYDTNDGYPRARVSGDDGATWGDIQIFSTGKNFILEMAKSASGPNGAAAVLWGVGNGAIYGAFWNESAKRFDVSVVAQPSGSQYFLQPSVAYDTKGTIHVAWREDASVYYAERQSDGSWRQTLITNQGPVRGSPSIATDSGGNVSLMWISEAGGAARVYYTFRPASGQFSTPVVSAPPGGALFNGAGTATLSSRAFGHFVAENFGARNLTRYFRFSSRGQSCVADATALRISPTDLVDGFTRQTTFPVNVSVSADCPANLVQIAINKTDDTAARTQIVDRAATVSVTIPPADLAKCTQTVYARYVTRASDGTETFQGDWFSTSIKVDPPNPGAGVSSVNADVQVYNQNTSPLSRDAATIASDDAIGDGASDGDSRFTRTRQIGVQIADMGDCSGVVSFSGLGYTRQPISNKIFRDQGATFGRSPSDPGPGAVTVPISVTDKVSNTVQVARTIFYDPADDPTNLSTDSNGRPVLSAGTLTGDDNAAARLKILRTISLSGVRVTDNLYNRANVPGVADNLNFWGVWISVEYLGKAGTQPPAADPNGPNRRWTPVQVQTSTPDFNVPVNLFTRANNGTDLTKDGTYRVYIRFLDGAGNYSTGTLSDGTLVTTLTLAPGYTLPQIMLPRVTS